MPLIGDLHLSGNTLKQAKNIIEKNLKDGYLIDPVVHIKSHDTGDARIAPVFSNARSIYIMGEVANPGNYMLPENAAHLLNIISVAGGYTKQADQNYYEIIRKIDGVHYRKKIRTGSLEFIDGDIILIKERS